MSKNRRQSRNSPSVVPDHYPKPYAFCPLFFFATASANATIAMHVVHEHPSICGCEMVYRHCTAQVDERVDMVITSGGGYPLDSTFYQISKAMIAARDILKKGGTIVVVCECREGLGNPEFCGIMTSVCSPQEFFDGYCDPNEFVIDQWCAQSIYQAIEHAGRVYIYSSGLSQADLEKTGAIKIEDVQETVDRLWESHAGVVAVPDGPYVVGICNT